MAQTQLYYIGTSKAKEIRVGASVTFDWGAYDAWTTFKSPVAASAKKVTYNKTSKNAAGGSTLAGAGGKTVLGSWIPATATRVVDGVSRVCDVRYYVRGYTIYTRTPALKKKKKMTKTVYNTAHPYQYVLQYKDKPVKVSDYSTYINGMDYIYFADEYYNDEGQAVATTGHLMQPQTFEVSYSDVRRNFDSSANNNDGRDNTGSYILSNVRANVVTIRLEWQGLSAEHGADLLDTLNPTKDATGEYNYLSVQYRDPATGRVQNKTFYASDRTAIPYPNGTFKEIAVTLTEV